MLLSVIVKFEPYLFLHCEKNENKQKSGRVWPFFTCINRATQAGIRYTMLIPGTSDYQISKLSNDGPAQYLDLTLKSKSKKCPEQEEPKQLLSPLAVDLIPKHLDK